MTWSRWAVVGDRLESSLSGRPGVDLTLWLSGDRVVWMARGYGRYSWLELIEHGSTPADLEGLSEAAAAAKEAAERWALARTGRPR